MASLQRLTAAVVLVTVVAAGCAASPAATDDPATAPDAVAVPTPGLSVPGLPTPQVRAPGTAPARPAPPTGSFAAAFPGDVAPGSVRWGASITGNGDPQRHESVTGVPLGVRRTYFGWQHRTGKMIDTARGDLAAGRLPWVSIKTPGWVTMASGARDAEIDAMLRSLDSLNGPVWLTVHHEPEGGNGTPYPDEGQGSEGSWRAMQVKIRERMNVVGTRNISFAPVLMSWTFNPQSKRLASDWWVDGVWDFAGIDFYVDDESSPSMETAQWNRTREYYADKGLKIAVGEWGNRGTDATAANEMSAFYQMALQSAAQPGRAQVIGMSYFDSSLNSSTGAWTLVGEPLNRFRQIMTLPNSLSATETG